ncbi:MAG TPA: CCA tRNA nucleotidyltransferase [Candidatus Paceibacterota bacterium]
MIKLEVPKEVLKVTETLQKAGFQAYIVGGCVRDLLLGVKPKDWDVTTDATPPDIEKLFTKTFYENDFGTVTVVDEETEEKTLRNIEITPFRIEGKYSNKRHPDRVDFSNKLEDDLKRRDFTINAMAYNPATSELVDLYKGQEDLKDKVVRAVGDPSDRFNEDALRIMRATRIATELNFEISHKTIEAIKNKANLLSEIAIERIQVEFTRVIMSTRAMAGIEQMHELGILTHIVPELEEGIGIKQNGDHIYEVWEHNLRALQNGADKNWPLHVRLAAMLHDIAKPKTREWNKEKNDWTFYGHDVVGGRMARKIMERLKYPNKITEVASKLVRYHMFFSDVDQITLSAVRRIVSKVGPENVADLVKLRVCDRVGMGRPKEKPYRLRKYESMVEEAMRAPVSVQMLKIDGEVLMKQVHVKPGPRMGWILHALLEEVLEDPNKNDSDYLVTRATELEKLTDQELKKLGESGKDKREEAEGKEIKEIRHRHGVK